MTNDSRGISIWKELPVIFAAMFGCLVGLMIAKAIPWCVPALVIPAFLSIASLTSRWVYEDWRDRKA